MRGPLIIRGAMGDNPVRLVKTMTITVHEPNSALVFETRNSYNNLLVSIDKISFELQEEMAGTRVYMLSEVEAMVPGGFMVRSPCRVRARSPLAILGEGPGTPLPACGPSPVPCQGNDGDREDHHPPDMTCFRVWPHYPAGRLNPPKLHVPRWPQAPAFAIDGLP